MAGNRGFCRSAWIPNASMNVTESDDTDLPASTVGVHVDGAGTVSLMFWGSGTSVERTVAAGTYISGNIRRILAADTDATGFSVDFIVD